MVTLKKTVFISFCTSFLLYKYFVNLIKLSQFKNTTKRYNQKQQ
jgi:hypothetical protein